MLVESPHNVVVIFLGVEQAQPESLHSNPANRMAIPNRPFDSGIGSFEEAHVLFDCFTGRSKCIIKGG